MRAGELANRAWNTLEGRDTKWAPSLSAIGGTVMGVPRLCVRAVDSWVTSATERRPRRRTTL